VTHLDRQLGDDDFESLQLDCRIATLPMLLAAESVVFLHERLGAIECVVLLLSAMGAVLISVSSGGSGRGPQPALKGD
jgi:drug/metabolite transporter (DMT)-like permease